MDNSPFNDLPAELRVRIYTAALCPTEGVGISFALDKDWNTPNERPVYLSSKARLLALTATCKQMREECTPVFFSVNTFHLHPRRTMVHVPNAHYKLLSKWLACIGTHNTSLLKKVVVNLFEWDCFWTGPGEARLTDLFADELHAGSRSSRDIYHIIIDLDWSKYIGSVEVPWIQFPVLDFEAVRAVLKRIHSREIETLRVANRGQADYKPSREELGFWP
ncbi:hypothetical protein LTR08_002796 [Meristemomyces frigidus]|nr:hypothetical protein LTR08_002796 [Meristemomyces frigidus]